METGKKKEAVSGLRALPSVDLVMKSEAAKEFTERYGSGYAARFARHVVDGLREELANGILPERTREELLENAEAMLTDELSAQRRRSLSRVINASGVIIHTNLGRAPLSEAASKAIEAVSGYCDLEYDLETGARGRRGERAEELAAELTGAEEALIVNNCAAAAVLVLTSLCEGGEAVISRGELVEIGGDFRVPDVMKRSGAGLAEVGTTNRTKLSDYEKAVNENTKLLLKVHPSNYRIIGFTSVPSVRDLADLAHSKGILLYEDAGSGALTDLSRFGLDDEPVIRESIEAGADVVTFSGDKLLGSVQSGLIVGKKDVIAKIRHHPLYRALRPGKMVYAALEATLEAFMRGTEFEEVPVLRMLSADREELARRAADLKERIDRALGEKTGGSVKASESDSVVGGGSAPGAHPRSPVIVLRHGSLTANDIELRLRNHEVPVIARIDDDAVILDLRTVAESEEEDLAAAVCAALG